MAVDSATEKNSPRAGKRGAPQAFPWKLYHMLSTEDQSVVRWTAAGDGFLIVNMDRFTDDVLQKYFRHRKFSSFQRQLNLYGFKKKTAKGEGEGSYATKNFLRTRPDLLPKVRRAPQSHHKAAKPGSPKQSAVMSGAGRAAVADRDTDTTTQKRIKPDLHPALRSAGTPASEAELNRFLYASDYGAGTVKGRTDSPGATTKRFLSPPHAHFAPLATSAPMSLGMPLGAPFRMDPNAAAAFDRRLSDGSQRLRGWPPRSLPVATTRDLPQPPASYHDAHAGVLSQLTEAQIAALMAQSPGTQSHRGFFSGPIPRNAPFLSLPFRGGVPTTQMATQGQRPGPPQALQRRAQPAVQARGPASKGRATTGASIGRPSLTRAESTHSDTQTDSGAVSDMDDWQRGRSSSPDSPQAGKTPGQRSSVPGYGVMPGNAFRRPAFEPSRHMTPNHASARAHRMKRKVDDRDGDQPSQDPLLLDTHYSNAHHQGGSPYHAPTPTKVPSSNLVEKASQFAAGHAPHLQHRRPLTNKVEPHPGARGHGVTKRRNRSPLFMQAAAGAAKSQPRRSNPRVQSIANSDLRVQAPQNLPGHPGSRVASPGLEGTHLDSPTLRFLNTFGTDSPSITPIPSLPHTPRDMGEVVRSPHQMGGSWSNDFDFSTSQFGGGLSPMRSLTASPVLTVGGLSPFTRLGEEFSQGTLSPLMGSERDFAANCEIIDRSMTGTPGTGFISFACEEPASYDEGIRA